jgi:hypothetical protein
MVHFESSWHSVKLTAPSTPPGVVLLKRMGGSARLEQRANDRENIGGERLSAERPRGSSRHLRREKKLTKNYPIKKFLHSILFSENNDSRLTEFQ